MRFSGFELDSEQFALRNGGRKLDLERMPMELLALLVEKRGELVGRDQIVLRLWGTETHVDATHGINTAVKKIRLALHDDANTPRFVETVRGKGYRFIAPVSTSNGSEVAASEGPLEPVPASSVATTPARKESTFSLPLAAAGAGLMSTVLLGFLHWRTKRGQPHKKFDSVAVLPLRNLSENSASEYFAEALTEELTTCLGQITRLRVPSHTSVLRYSTTRPPLPDLGKALNVNAVVEGSVFQSGKDLRISVQLIDAPADTHLWAHSYEWRATDPLAVLKQLGREVSDQIVAVLTQLASKAAAQ